MTIADSNGRVAEFECLLTLRLKIAALVLAYSEIFQDSKLLGDALYRLQDFIAGLALTADLESELQTVLDSGSSDPAFILAISTAYACIRKSCYSTTEVADAITHIYVETQKGIKWNRPPEIRILKYILSLEDEFNIAAELRRATINGPHIETEAYDYLSTTNERLLQTLDAILRAYREVKNDPISALTTGTSDPVVIKRAALIKATLSKREL